MKLKLIRTHSVCVDEPTGMEGTICGIEIGKHGTVKYWFQPLGLNPTSKKPFKYFCVDEWRLTVKESDYEEQEIPCHLIGAVATDKLSGYKGMVLSIVIHLNGCMHYVLQAKGVDQSGDKVSAIEIDPRSCLGLPLPPVLRDSPGEPFGEQGFEAT